MGAGSSPTEPWIEAQGPAPEHCCPSFAQSQQGQHPCCGSSASDARLRTGLKGALGHHLRVVSRGWESGRPFLFSPSWSLAGLVGKAMTSVVSESLDFQLEEISHSCQSQELQADGFGRGWASFLLPHPKTQSSLQSAARPKPGGHHAGRPARPVSSVIRKKPAGRRPERAHQALRYGCHLHLFL